MGETVSGAQSIRAYRLESKFINMLETKVDFNQKSSYAGIVAARLVICATN